MVLHEKVGSAGEICETGVRYVYGLCDNGEECVRNYGGIQG